MEFRLYVRALIWDEEGKILLVQKQSNQAIAPGRWILPGGAVEFGEKPVAALKRELKEETKAFWIKEV